MTYRIDKPARRRTRKWLWWLLVIMAAVLYSLVVYGWWVEGNRNFDGPVKARSADGL